MTQRVLSQGSAPSHGEQHGSVPALTLGALGVVYGDIGTSPLYALKEAARAASAGGTLQPGAVVGCVSMILWALILIISLKYSLLIMRADNRGEGGIMAMLALLKARHAKPGTARAYVLVVGLVGAALLYGDGAITPAISVLSAIEGLKVDAPFLAPAIVPLTAAILIGVFLVQSKGTGFIGKLFGPIMLLWFIALALLGIRGILMAPGILSAINPFNALYFITHTAPLVGFAVLGATFLAVTGGEAMYADMGHFGPLPIRIAWLTVVLPALMLNYFGQGGLLLSHPEALENPFYQLAPDWAHYPMVVFATAAAVIASQAVITGAFSLTRQAVQLGLFPAIRIKHTADDQKGQIYIPIVNWLICLATLTSVFMFRSSDALAGAYGIAVSLLMAITTGLAALIALKWSTASSC
jgi:KUP system potassium uptake protein